MRATDEKITIIETLRGIASLSVLLLHWTVCVPGFIHNPLAFALCSKLNVGVYIFFAISGFIMPYAMYRGGYQLRYFSRFVLKRIARLDPPFIVSIGFCLLMAYAASLHPLYTGAPFRLNPLNLLLHLCYLCPFFGQPWVQGGIYWTLGIEFQFYILLALIFPLLVTTNKSLTFAVLTLFTALCVVDGHLFQYKFITVNAPFFSMGILTFLLRIGRINIRSYFPLMFVLAGVAALKFPWHQVTGGLVTSLLIAFYRQSRSPLLFFGTISYSLYLFHFPIALKTVNYLMRYSWAVKFNWVIVLAGSTFCVFLGWLAYLIIEQPSKRLAQSIKYVPKESVVVAMAAPDKCI